MTTTITINIERRVPVVERPQVVAGVAHDGQRLWVAAAGELHVIDPDSGNVQRILPIASDAGTAFDGAVIYQLSEEKILRITPETGEVIGSIPAPAPGGGKDSGLAWAEGALWVGNYQDRNIAKIDPETGEALRLLKSSHFVTGVTWQGDELWHGAVDEDERCALRRLDPESAEVLAELTFPKGVSVSGLAMDEQSFFCGGGSSGQVNVVSRPCPK